MMGVELLHFLDAVAEDRRRRDMVLSSAVSSGLMPAFVAWPEYFAKGDGTPGSFPSTGADMTEFELEEATPQSFMADMDAILAANQRVTVREAQEPVFQPSGYVPHTEWT
jgi:hypothetical protein